LALHLRAPFVETIALYSDFLARSTSGRTSLLSVGIGPFGFAPPIRGSLTGRGPHPV
jgi:hypothetical protein